MQGGVLPWWQQGSSDTYRVASADLGPAAARIASTSAWADQRAVKALPQHAVEVREHRPDERIGAHLAAAVLGELDRAGEVLAVCVGARGGHFCLAE